MTPWPNHFMEPSPGYAYESALAGGVAGPAWLIIGQWALHV